jgi:hypothetical protein
VFVSTKLRNRNRKRSKRPNVSLNTREACSFKVLKVVVAGAAVFVRCVCEVDRGRLQVYEPGSELTRPVITTQTTARGMNAAVAGKLSKRRNQHARPSMQLRDSSRLRTVRIVHSRTCRELPMRVKGGAASGPRTKL